MVKRLVDIILSALLLLLAAPVLLLCMLAIFLQDGGAPVYRSWRIGLAGRPFHIHKLRSMVIDADRIPIDTAASDDARITPLGYWLRRCKLDELPQLVDVLAGKMSLVGPRPQVEREVRRYTEVEKGLLAMRPGMTDFSSIVFADLGDIIAGHADPNVAYSQLVRPWKSRLGLFYINHHALWVDFALLALTALAILSKPAARRGVAWLLRRLHAPAELVAVGRRSRPLVPTPPPGSDRIVMESGR